MTTGAGPAVRTQDRKKRIRSLDRGLADGVNGAAGIRERSLERRPGIGRRSRGRRPATAAC